MSKYTFGLFFLMFSFNTIYAQKISWKRLGANEKLWVLLHPFSANEAKELTKEAITTADSVAKAEEWPILKSGGEKDAFRHAFWMAMLADRIGPKRALSLGVAHEKKNRKDFKRGSKEEGTVPDLKSEQMDIFNNDMGVYLSKQCENCEKNEMIKKVISALENGELKVIRMDKEGNSLDIKGKVIPREKWEGKWENGRVLVPSDLNL